jgi:hypothetical protein
MTETNMANLYGKKSKDQIKYEGQMSSDKVLKKKAKKKKTYTIFSDGTSAPKTKKNKALMDAVRKSIKEERSFTEARKRARRLKSAKHRGIYKPKGSSVGDTRGIIRYI